MKATFQVLHTFRPFRVKLRSPGAQPAGPLYPQLQTNRCIGLTDAMGQFRTYAPQQIELLVYPIVGGQSGVVAGER